jgi:hypothetical protein
VKRAASGIIQAGPPVGARASLTSPEYNFATNRGPTSITSSSYDTSMIAQPQLGNGNLLRALTFL